MGNIVNIYFLPGTIPSLYAQINIFLDKTPSYVWVRSAGLFDKGNIPDNCVYYRKLDGFDELNFIAKECADITDKIVSVKKSTPDVKFHVYVEDTRVQYILKPLIKANIYDEVEKFILVSEGSITEGFFDTINDKYDHDMRTKWEYFIDALKGDSKNIDAELAAIGKYAPWFATNGNVEYLVPYRNLLIGKMQKINYNYEKMNLKDLDIEEKFLKLNREQKNYFTGECDKIFAKEEKSLIIIGTYDIGSPTFTAYIYISLINKMMADIVGNYKIFYKAHPVFPVSTKPELEEYLLLRGIEILPTKMPIEVILWDNKNIDIAGFCSSVNANVAPLRTIAFFGERIGFAKLMDRSNMFDAKIYNIEVSQDFAIAVNKDRHASFENLHSLHADIADARNGFLSEKKQIARHGEQLLDSEYRIAQLETQLLVKGQEFADVVRQVKTLTRRMEKMLILLKPLLFLKRKIFKGKR